MRALRGDDKEETVYADELTLLRRIAETSHDLIEGRHWDEFREACGGIKWLETAHEAAVLQYEEWLTLGEG